LRHDAKARPDGGPVSHRVTTENGKLTLRRRRDTAKHPHRGGLPGTVGAKEPKSLTGQQIEINSVYRSEAAKSLGEASGADEYFGH
jgi:hypothetical protein